MGEGPIVRMMVQRFRQNVQESLGNTVQNPTNGLSFAQTMVLASLVEKETRQSDEKAHLAGVLVNRLRDGLKLQCSSSLRYAEAIQSEDKGQAHRNKREDAVRDSAFNTFRHRGLPPHPICSPGIDSIRAAMNPMATRDRYYVARPDGYHIFSETQADYRHAIARVRQMERDLAL